MMNGYFYRMRRFTELQAVTKKHDAKAKEFDQQLSELAEIS